MRCNTFPKKIINLVRFFIGSFFTVRMNINNHQYWPQNVGGVISYVNFSAELYEDKICELFVRFFGSSSLISSLAKILDIEIVAFVRNPYGKRSGYFHEHRDRSFDSTLASDAMHLIDNPMRFSAMVNFKADYYAASIPVYLNGICVGYILIGKFFLGDDNYASLPQKSDIPTIKRSKVESLISDICKEGSRILEYSYNYIMTDVHDTKTDYDSIYMYGNYFDFNFLNDTFTLSRTAANVLGFEPGEYISLDAFYNIVDDSERTRLSEYLRSKVLVGGEEINFIAPIRRKDDQQLIWVEAIGNVVRDDKGYALRASGYINDITYLKRLQLRYQEESEAKTRLIRIIGHDLKNPFNALIGFSELMCKSIDSNELGEALEFAKIIKVSASEGYDLLVNLLDYSNSLSGNIKFEPSEFCLFETVESVLRLSSAQASHKGITLRNNVGRNTMLFADEPKISTVLRNLISNAIKFCYESRDVAIGCEPMPDGKLRITVRDEGMEIPEETLARINNGETVKSTAGTASEKGTSIGLKLCHTFLGIHNSKLFAHCDGNLTTFGFDI